MVDLSLRIAGYQGEASVHTRAVHVLARTLSAHLPGRVEIAFTVDITKTGRRAGELLPLVESGGLDICYFSSSYLAERVPALGVFDLPFAIADRTHIYERLAGALGAKLSTDVANTTGYRVLGFWDNGFRHVSNRLQPIRTPQDCRGMTLRTLDNALHREVFAALGFEPVTIDVKFLAEAVEKHDVDAQENPLTNLYHFGMHRTHRHVSLTSHFFGVALLLMNRARFEALAADFQSALQDAADAATAAQRQYAAAEDDACRALLAADGVAIVPPQDIDLDTFRKAVAPIVQREIVRIGSETLTLLD
jgi:TRAP-type C4-dicarboxylate transport system substrate-binding protein